MSQSSSPTGPISAHLSTARNEERNSDCRMRGIAGAAKGNCGNPGDRRPVVGPHRGDSYARFFNQYSKRKIASGDGITPRLGLGKKINCGLGSAPGESARASGFSLPMRMLSTLLIPHAKASFHCRGEWRGPDFVFAGTGDWTTWYEKAVK